ncbi:nucleoside triphosphate pyrophosphohydrolase [Salinactinospora qingdaonensis]|uniref:Nucleoside triphosphate pyrophosphohydrolase n=1 Tax=Salinactinospora qingdaonensis TaxID=702744 RepID=A0ABP7GG20_9ACTN
MRLVVRSGGLGKRKRGKLVRDRIPHIIRSEGGNPVTHTAGPQEYRHRLREKLSEEVAEFLAAKEDRAPEELADILEVIHALAHDLGIDEEKLEKIRRSKAEERGGFADRVIWSGNR